MIEVLFEQEQPVDYRFLETNPSFNEQTGLAHPRGKRMRDLSLSTNNIGLMPTAVPR